MNNFRPQNIPEELKALPRWVVFALETTKEGKVRKTPYVPGSDHLASSRQPSDWRPFEIALADAERHGRHVAFVFGPELPYVFIDADNAFTEDRDIRTDVKLFVDTLDTYTEVSVGGQGLHVICRGALPERFVTPQAPAGCKQIEFYPRLGPRFCVFTGDTRPGLGSLDGLIEDRPEELLVLLPSVAPIRVDKGENQGVRGRLVPFEERQLFKWASAFWADGRRHHMALHLSGFLGKEGVPRDQAVALVERLAANDSDPDEKINAAHDSYDALDLGLAVSGYCGLRDVCGIPESDLRALSGIFSGFRRRAIPQVSSSQPEPHAKLPPPAAPVFPLNVFPPVIAESIAASAASIRSVSEASGAVGTAMLAALGSLIGNRWHVAAKYDWREYGGLYVGIVADPSWGKTPAISAADAPLRRLQKLAFEEKKERDRQYRDELDEWKAKSPELRGTRPPEPNKLRHFYSTDYTMEAIKGGLENSPGIAVIKDELSGWIRDMNKYRAGSDRQEYCSLWSNANTKTDRKKDGGTSTLIEKPVVSVIGGIQPEMAPLLIEDVKGRDGFIERLLVFVPDPPTAPKLWSDSTVSREQYAALFELFERIDSCTKWFDDPDTNYGYKGTQIMLSGEARDVWIAWYNANQRLAFTEKGVINGMYGKLAAHVLRFALILHVAWNPDDPRVMINKKCMEGATELAEFYRAHYARFLPLIGSVAPETVAIPLSRVEHLIRKTAREQNGDEGGWLNRSTIAERLRLAANEVLAELERLESIGVVERRSKAGKTRPAEQWQLKSYTNDAPFTPRPISYLDIELVDARWTEYSESPEYPEYPEYPEFMDYVA